MSWTYRVVKSHWMNDMEYAIVEHYDVGGHTQPITVTTWASHDDEPSEEKSIENLRWQLTEMLKALDKPVIDIGEYDNNQ